jgi:hypothetical protein
MCSVQYLPRNRVSRLLLSVDFRDAFENVAQTLVFFPVSQSEYVLQIAARNAPSVRVETLTVIVCTAPDPQLQRYR